MKLQSQAETQTVHNLTARNGMVWLFCQFDNELSDDILLTYCLNVCMYRLKGYAAITGLKFGLASTVL